MSQQEIDQLHEPWLPESVKAIEQVAVAAHSREIYTVNPSTAIPKSDVRDVIVVAALQFGFGGGSTQFHDLPKLFSVCGSSCRLFVEQIAW